MSVSRGSLASELGIREGDRLVAINGTPVGDYSPRDLLRNLSDQRFVRAVFDRNGSVFDRVFRRP